MQNAVLLAILLAAGLTTPPVVQRLQPDFICWESDMEFPVDCGDEED
ncbi:MAG: hypothetical protein ACK4TP_16200 [Hyphomicrobium sp.]|jgi:hypothetical protein